MEILKESNPFDLSDVECGYIGDIWGGHNWANDENEKPIIGLIDHSKLINLIMLICKEKKYFHVKWTDEIKKYWIELIAEYLVDTDFQDNNYFISYDEFNSIHKIKFDFNDKESIKLHINLYGKKETWIMIKNNCNENFLDFIL